MNFAYGTFSTPLGDFSAAIDERGAIVATAFGNVAALRSRAGKCHLLNDTSRVRLVRDQVTAYFAGDRRDFDLPLAPDGTPFQHRVWRALGTIPFGQTRSYGQVAEQIGNPAASRAVGRANATNPICLLVPCHRVIGADGSLTGFAFGEQIKRRLLEHERATVLRVRAA